MDKIKERFYSFVSMHKEGVAWTILTLAFLVGLELKDFFASTAFLRTVGDLATAGWLVALAFIVYMNRK